MKRFLLGGAAAVLAAGVPGTVSASGDYGCDTKWTLVSRGFDCADRAFLTPGNDTRVNLAMLLRDRAGLTDAVGKGGLAYPAREYDAEGFGHTFLDWDLLQLAYWPGDAGGEVSDNAGSRCVSLKSGEAGFKAALAAQAGLTAAERGALAAARGGLSSCDGKDPAPAWPVTTSAAGAAFLGYLKSTEAFYAGRWDEARGGYAALRSAPAPWVSEAARYMLARVELGAAIAPAIDDYGWPDLAKVDRPATARALTALADYLTAYPTGAYAGSATGLVRRGLWLGGQAGPLAATYEKLLARRSPADPATGELLDEIDNKLLTQKYADQVTDGPLLLATLDLMRMRRLEDDAGKVIEAPTLSAAELAGQARAFAGRPELYDFLRAAHAFYVADDAKAVLKIIPDDARRGGYTPLGFSRQVLRGLALGAARDPNEAGFWRELMSGATGLWQRPTVELGLARNWELAGRTADVFAAGSPVLDPTIRGVLLQTVAGPEVLRADARAAARPQTERDIALFALLYKNLNRGRYADFVADSALLRKGANTDGGLWSGFDGQKDIPLGLFAAGKWSDGYACPAIARTAATLARSPDDVSARLCLGDFWRLNGFDQFTALDQPRAKGTLGSSKSQFPGAPLARGEIYAALIASPATPAADKAYALYRAIACYGPSGYNSCRGADVEPAQRKAWFQRLKRDYPGTTWAKKADYYW